MSHHFRNLRWILAATALGLVAGAASAQTTWEFDPYEVEIWVVAGDSPQISAGLLDELRGELQTAAALGVGAPWRTKVSPPPAELAGDVALLDFDVPVARLKELAPGLFQREPAYHRPPPAIVAETKPVAVKQEPPKHGSAAHDSAGHGAHEPAKQEPVKQEPPKPVFADLDKLFTVRVDSDARGYVVFVRQFDQRSRRWSAPIERATPQRESLGVIAWEAITAAFTPSARIEKVETATISARMRAGGLIVDPDENPAGFRPGDALEAVVRRNDRTGEPAKGVGISTALWTAMVVKERENSLLRCDLYTGIRGAIPTRGGPRTERLVFRTRPRFDHTDLVLESRTKDSQPLEGFEIFSRPAGTEENNLLGRTDWRGVLEIPILEKSAVQTLYIRSGGKVVAKLPIISGLEQRASIRLPDDGRRLHAEGLVAAMQSRLTDLVARSQIHAARIRAKIKQGKPADALPLLEEMRGFETRADLLRELDDYVANVRSPDKATQFRIDKLFGEARKLLAGFLDPQLVNQLKGEIDKALKNPTPDDSAQPVTPTPEPTPTPPMQTTPTPAPVQSIPTQPMATTPMPPIPGVRPPEAAQPAQQPSNGLKTGL